MKIYFCSDLHFGHKNILKYEPCRIDLIWEHYFKEIKDKNTFRAEVLSLYERDTPENEEQIKKFLELHDNILIKNWNNTVSGQDIVWFLGDLCLGGKKAADYVPKLNGQLKMVMGNHDMKPVLYYYNAGFTFVSKYPIVLKQKFILSHAPLENIPQGYFNIFGHVHSNPDYETSTETSYCACVERNNFKPFTLEIFNKA